MNKLASIFLLRDLELPTINPMIVTERTPKKVARQITGFYYPREDGWAVRCAELPNIDGRVERNLPWGLAQTKAELADQVLHLQSQVGEGYVVFCHHAYKLARGASMLIEGGRVVVEARAGNLAELSKFYRGYLPHQQRIVFSPGMIYSKRDGQEVLSLTDLLELRRVEKALRWPSIKGVLGIKFWLSRD